MPPGVNEEEHIGSFVRKTYEQEVLPRLEPHMNNIMKAHRRSAARNRQVLW